MEKKKPIYTKEKGSILPNVSKWLIKQRTKKQEEKRIIKKVTAGKFKNQELKYLANGLDILRLLYFHGVDILEWDLLSSDKERSKKENIIKALMVFTRRNVDIILSQVSGKMWSSYYEQKKLADFEKNMEILAKTNGIITTMQTKTEIIDGKETEIQRERVYSQKEIYDILNFFQLQKEGIEDHGIEELVNVGLSIATFLGTVTENIKQSDKPMLTGTLLASGIAGGIGNFVYKQKLQDKEENKVREKRRNVRFYEQEMIETEPVSQEDERYMREKTKQSMEDYQKAKQKLYGRLDSADTGLSLAISLMVGALTINQVVKEGKFTVSSIPKILAQFGANTRVISGLGLTMGQIKRFQERRMDYKEVLEEVQNIVKQIEEKAEKLTEVTHPFTRLSLQDVTLNFYQTENEQGGEKYGKTLTIPEFHADTGEIVLVTGKSGNGKSTLLKHLKNGDIHNPKTIAIDGTEKVDKIGKKAVMFSSRMRLSDMTNILGQITRKERLEELTAEERQKFVAILKDLELYREGKNMKDIISKRYSEFSSGQKNRIALAKVLYMLDDSKQVLLLDEPTNFVEKELRRKTFHTIQKYCKQGKPKTIIIATHDIEIAEEVANRRYNITEEGLVEEVPIQKNKEERC